MSDSDDDEPLDPTSYFLYDLRHEETWDVEAVRQYVKETLEILENIDFGELPERKRFSEEVMRKYGVVPEKLEQRRSVVYRQTGFMFPLTLVYVSKEVQTYYKLMHVTQKKIENVITNMVNNHKHKVTTDELLQPLFSWILVSFDRPLPVKFESKFDPLPVFAEIGATEPSKYADTRYGNRVLMRRCLLTTRSIYRNLMVDTKMET